MSTVTLIAGSRELLDDARLTGLAWFHVSLLREEGVNRKERRRTRANRPAPSPTKSRATSARCGCFED